MKACSLFVPVWLAPALAAPVFYTSTTLLVAGSTSHRPVFRPSHLVENEHEQSSSQRPVLFGGGRPHTIEDIPSTPSLDSERPLSTEQLMALGSPRTHQSSSPETFASPPSSAALLSSLPVSEKAPKGKPRVVTVGTLVVLEADRPFLLPGYYIPARPRGDVLIMGGIVALLLLALAMESLKTSLCVPTICSRRKSIRLLKFSLLQLGKATSEA